MMARHSDRMEQLVEDHAAGLKLYARALGASGEEAEDIVAEAYAALWRQLAHGKTIESPAAYLATSVRHAAARLARRETRRRELESKAAAPDWFEEGSDPELARWAARVLEELPAEQREIVVLRIWSSLSFRQIGIVLGIPTSTASHRYRTALKTLRDKENNDEQ